MKFSSHKAVQKFLHHNKHQTVHNNFFKYSSNAMQCNFSIYIAHHACLIKKLLMCYWLRNDLTFYDKKEAFSHHFEFQFFSHYIKAVLSNLFWATAHLVAKLWPKPHTSYGLCYFQKNSMAHKGSTTLH